MSARSVSDTYHVSCVVVTFILMAFTSVVMISTLVPFSSWFQVLFSLVVLDSFTGWVCPQISLYCVFLNLSSFVLGHIGSWLLRLFCWASAAIIIWVIQILLMAVSFGFSIISSFEIIP